MNNRKQEIETRLKAISIRTKECFDFEIRNEFYLDVSEVKAERNTLYLEAIELEDELKALPIDVITILENKVSIARQEYLKTFDALKNCDECEGEEVEALETEWRTAFNNLKAAKASLSEAIAKPNPNRFIKSSFALALLWVAKFYYSLLSIYKPCEADQTEPNYFRSRIIECQTVYKLVTSTI